MLVPRILKELETRSGLLCVPAAYRVLYIWNRYRKVYSLFQMSHLSKRNPHKDNSKTFKAASKELARIQSVKTISHSYGFAGPLMWQRLRSGGGPSMKG